jgi:hypothetical protein
VDDVKICNSGGYDMVPNIWLVNVAKISGLPVKVLGPLWRLRDIIGKLLVCDGHLMYIVK